MLKIRGMNLNVLICGEKKPFIWAHGLMASMALEDSLGWFQWDNLAKHARVIRYDARGHGKSEASDSPADYHWSNLAMDMLTIADQLNLTTFIAAGQSMGSATALYAALAAPQRISALVLVNPPTAWETRTAQAAMYQKLARAANILGPRLMATSLNISLERLLPAWLVEAMGDQVRVYTETLASFDKNTLVTVLKGASLSNLPDREELKKLNIPALILAWQGDSSHPVETAESLHALLSRSHLYIAEDMDDLHRWPQLIKEFVVDSVSNMA
jgi:pimeloyl-ACP methyl ester carboxylesterase